MDQCGPPAEVHDSLSADIDDSLKKDTGCDNSPKGSLSESNLEDIDKTNIDSEVDNPKIPNTPRSVSSINLRSTSKTRIEYQPDVGRTGPPPTTHSNMKTKQIKEELDKSIDEETTIEPKTRARKKASEISEEVKSNSSQDEPKTSKDPKKPISKPKAVAKKRPLGIRKTLRSKKTVITKDKVKNVIKQAVKRGRKAAIKTEPENSQEKETVPLIPASEIKKEPADDTTPNSRSSSPRTAGRRQRLSSDLIMMKSMLGDSPSSLVLGPRTSPYSMRSERSNSPSMFEGKNLRSGKPRKVKNNLLNEVVMKEQKKRRRLLSDSKGPEATEGSEDCKKLKRGRSCSRDGSEISKCSDITESDLSLSESINDTDGKELNKKLDKPKTELDLDIETNVQISTIEKVPSLNVDSKLAETKQDTEPSCIVNEKNKKSLSLKRSTSLDSDNNNSNRLKLENLNSSDVEDKSSMKTENDTLFEARSSILTSMSKTFNSKEVSKNIRKARRGRKAAAATRTSPNQAKNCISSTITNEPAEEKQETLESLSKEIDDLINNLDQNIDCDISNDVNANATDQLQTKPASKSYNASKPLGDNNSIICPETPVKDKDALATITNDSTPSKNDDSENIRLHYEDDTTDKSTDSPKQEVTFKCTPVASIDKLMDRLKEFEEFDKRRQRQESESKSSDGKPVILTSDVVLITKSGTDIKHLKDIQTVRSPERPIEKENVLSCFENNSAISIVKRDQFRKSIDVDLPNSVTLIKRNSISARKESTSSNHSRESDAISIFEKSLGKDVTLTEIRKSVDRPAPAQVDLHQFATLHPTNPNQSLAGVVLDSSQISITPRIINEVQITKRKSRESMSRKSSESTIELDEKVVTIEKIKSPTHQIKNLEVSITPNPVAVKSPEAQPVETEALAPPLDSVKDLPENITLTSKVTEVTKAETPKVEPVPVETAKAEIAIAETPKVDAIATTEVKPETEEKPEIPVPNPEKVEPEKMEVDTVEEKPKNTVPPQDDVIATVETKPTEPIVKTVKDKRTTRHSMDSQPGPSNVLHETPESQKRKENVLRTLGLLTHKAAKEAKIEKLKEKERIYMMSNKSKAVKSGSGDYTGTLKTVIKLNRNSGEREKKKYRSSLKMTFQKSKNRSGKPQPEVGEGVNDDETYYTIERREGGTGSTSDGGHRKSYSNRLNHDIEAAPEPVEPKEILNLVIPEKASSFSIHPGRLCMDQCFYCGGKFGLFDTPCHIAQMKSSERQKKVLDNEEKLTIDSCLCDACYRHVDRRANCPSYRKRPAKLAQTLPPNNQQPAPVSPPLEDESEEEGGAGGGAGAGAGALPGAGARRAACHTAGCQAPADHAIRRKWLIKMRASVNKLLQLEGDYPGLHTIPLCGDHHRALAPLLACALCRRRVTKHHNAHLLHTYAETNPLLQQAGIPVQFAERPVLCKMCRYYCTLLQRPGHNEKHARGYRRKLLQIYNIEVPPESDHEPEEATVQEDPNITKQKKKTRTKSKQRKSTEPEKPGDSESSEKTESSPEKDNRTAEEEKSTSQPIEEDIESLISSNKIPVPGAKPPEQIHHSDGSETDVFDYETPSMPVDKQTELQYLLQKQNNPAQFLHKPPNLTQKHRSLMKLQNASGVTKPSQQHRINDKNAKRIQKLGQIVTNKEKTGPKEDVEMFDPEKQKDGMAIFKNLSLNDECTIETIPNKKPADINTLKNKWQMSESFSQVKKNLSELSKKLTVEKEPKKHSDAKYSNPVKRLETNPSISVRELFPGEEEMNLQCNIEFNNVKGVTPEGWEKCNTMIQYDGETKRLWNELQRPYGNQSSFLRHLILLEKYFRSGDLVLSHNASPPAANYSDSVQSRLRAYDNVVNDTPRRSEPAISLIEYRKKPSVNGKSLLKTSQGEGEKDPKKTMPPPTLPKPKPAKSDKAKSKPLPPELIAINTPNAQGRKAIQNVLHNIQQLVKGVSASDPTEVAAAPLPLPKFEPPKEKKESPKETPKKQKPTSKPWRPTLMPITPENLAKIAREPIQVAVDGRHLPSLVQVMSSGKRYHITLQDYNKMCIMRREKLQQLQDGDKTKKPDETTVVTEIQTSAMLGNGGTVVQNIQPEKETEKKEMPELGQISTNAANILKNVGLKNITIAPIPPKTATVTSQTVSSPVVTSPSLLVTSTPIKLPQLGSAVSITSETVLTPNLPIISTSMIMPKIPKSLTVIPQTVVAPSVVLPQPQTVMPQMVLPQNVVMPQSVVVPQSVMVPTTAAPVQPSDTPRP